MHDSQDDLNKAKNDLNETNNDWQELQSEWQAYRPDVKKIQKKTNWVTIRMVALLVFEVIFVCGYLGFLIYSKYYREVSTSLNIWNYFIGVLAVIGLYLDFKLRLPLLRTQGDSTKAVLGFYLERTNLGIVLGRWSILFCWILIIGFNLWVVFNHIYYPEEVELSSLSFWLFGNIWIGGFLLIFYWYKNKKLNEYTKLSALWQDYLD